MEHARFEFITVDPKLTVDVARIVSSDGRRRIEEEPGNRGVALLVNRELGVLIAESFWVSGDAMRESKRGFLQLREAARHLGMCTVSSENFEIASSFRKDRPYPGAGVQVTRADVELGRVNHTIASYEDLVVPRLGDTNGFCTSMFLLQRKPRRLVIEAMWKDPQSLAASRSSAAKARADFVTATDCAVRDLNEHRLDFIFRRSA
jgi:hypothetical protein